MDLHRVSSNRGMIHVAGIECLPVKPVITASLNMMLQLYHISQNEQVTVLIYATVDTSVICPHLYFCCRFLSYY